MSREKNYPLWDKSCVQQDKSDYVVNTGIFIHNRMRVMLLMKFAF